MTPAEQMLADLAVILAESGEEVLVVDTAGQTARTIRAVIDRGVLQSMDLPEATEKAGLYVVKVTVSRADVPVIKPQETTFALYARLGDTETTTMTAGEILTQDEASFTVGVF